MLFDSLSESDGVRQALRLNPAAGRILSTYHEQILRGESPLTVPERELIAAYVSGLNQCRYCHETHRETAINFGVSGELVSALVADPELRDADDRMRPLLDYARKLTLAQTRLTRADADAVRDAGWSERALHDLILVVAMFNFMNRFVHGHGIHAGPEQWQASGRFLHDHGYGVLAAELAEADAA